MELENATIERCLPVAYGTQYPDETNSLTVILVFGLIYSMMFVLGIFGNSAILYVTLKDKSLQTVQNIFLMNLAFADLLVVVISLPITPVSMIYKTWYFGTVTCKLLPWLMGVTILITSYGLVAIAVDRYMLIIHCHRSPIDKRKALMGTAILWAVSAVVILPYAYAIATKPIADYMRDANGTFYVTPTCGEFCDEAWPNGTFKEIYTASILVTQFLVPFTIMTFCYCRILVRLHGRAQQKMAQIKTKRDALEKAANAPLLDAPSNNTPPLQTPQMSTSTLLAPGSNRNSTRFSLAANQSNRSKASSKASRASQRGRRQSYNPAAMAAEKDRQRVGRQNRRNTLILVLMVVIFFLTYLPQNLYSILLDYAEEMPNRALLGLIAHCLAMSNNVANPIMYAFLNEAFREAVVNTFFSCKTPRQRAFARQQQQQQQRKPAPKRNNLLPSVDAAAANRKCVSTFASPPTVRLDTGSRSRVSLPAGQMHQLTAATAATQDNDNGGPIDDRGSRKEGIRYEVINEEAMMREEAPTNSSTTATTTTDGGAAPSPQEQRRNTGGDSAEQQPQTEAEKEGETNSNNNNNSKSNNNNSAFEPIAESEYDDDEGDVML